MKRTEKNFSNEKFTTTKLDKKTKQEKNCVWKKENDAFKKITIWYLIV